VPLDLAILLPFEDGVRGQRVGRELDSIARVRGYPCMVVSKRPPIALVA
jgi:hypothetical protein